MSRLLSYSEVSRALTCQAQWDFSYGGHLAGSALKRKAILPILSGGRAWGAMVATWHASQWQLLGYTDAIAAMDASLEADADRQRAFGVHDTIHHIDLRTKLVAIFDHYITVTDPIDVKRLEERLIVPIPSRTGKRASTKYKFICYFDGVTETYRPGETWLVEYKLRGQLSSVELIANSRQLRWYAWAYERKYGVDVHGVLTEERLNEAPKPARLVQPRRKGEGFIVGGYDVPVVASHAKDQITTPELYHEACVLTGQEVNDETFQHLAQRRWSQRVPILFRQGELGEAGQELVSAAKQIRDLDSGETLPIRNVRPANCNGCQFRRICPSPDPALVEEEFERTVPKRDRPDFEESEKVEAIAA